MGADEQVLVVERAVVEDLGAFQGLQFDVDRYVQRLLAAGIARFVRRGDAEDDPSLKQLIPYVLMRCDGKYLSYVRGKRAGESRLKGLRSLGIGGHINPEDHAAPLFAQDMHDAYQAAVAREVAEEVDVQAAHHDRIVALLNDDSNPVGQVHLGVVHVWQLDRPAVEKREQMITQMAWLRPDELASERENMETWSQVCVDNLPAIETQLGRE